MFEIKRTDDLPIVGMQNSYLTGHEELHSLSTHLNVPNIRFWMGFGDHYINVFNVLKNLGLLSVHPVKTAEGVEVIPIKVVKAVLPDPASLAPNYTGKTCIGNLVKGKKTGKTKKSLFIMWQIIKKPMKKWGAKAFLIPPVYQQLRRHC